jgi:hypothetical protein
MNLFGTIVAGLGMLAGSPALGGGVLVCDRFHCRSSPYFPPPIIYTRPPVISTYRGPPPPEFVPFRPFVKEPSCSDGVDIYPPGWDRSLPPPEGYRRRATPCPGPTASDLAAARDQARGLPPPYPRREAAAVPRTSRPDVAVPPPDAEEEAASKAEIEQNIIDFCDKNPEEQFCGKLGAFLRKHPDRRQR